MELDEAFEFAVVLAWEDLAKVSKPRAVRIEYLCEPGTAVDYLSVWSVRAGVNRIWCATTGRGLLRHIQVGCASGMATVLSSWPRPSTLS